MDSTATTQVRPARLGFAGLVALAWLAGALAPCVMATAEAAPLDAHASHGMPLDAADGEGGCCPPAESACDGDCADLSPPGCADSPALASERHDPRPDLLLALHETVPAPLTVIAHDPPLPHPAPPVLAGSALRTRLCSFLE